MSKDGMTLEEAIRSLKEDGKHVVRAALSLQGGTVLGKAIQLGIEALERIGEIRDMLNKKQNTGLSRLEVIEFAAKMRQPLPSEEE